ncbi:MAG: hypothetical protein NC039_04500 [Muribaculaceae bacterium]|nr:hypothetical protein [Muribaculaceae bacterium]
MFDALKRRWRRRGHGVHSPYAFRLVTEVFRDPGAYYAYPLLERTAKGAGIAPRRLKLLFRLMCEFAPERVHVTEALTDAERTAIMAADSRICLTHGEAPVSYLPAVPSSLPDEGVVIIREAIPGSLKALTSGRRHGMVFIDGRLAVIVMRKDLPPQDFEI